MKIKEFRIKNFKSIIDTGWCSLSADNITAVIGQNESGKSSILEALYSFDSKNLNEDHVRDTSAYPEVAVSYEISQAELDTLLNGQSYGEEIANHIKKDGSIIRLLRTWSNAGPDSSNLNLFDEPLRDLISEISDREPPNIDTESVEDTEPPEPPEAPDPPEPAVPEEPAGVKFDLEKFYKDLYTLTPDIELFQDNASLLPSTVDLEAVKDENSEVAGVQVARNYLTIMGLTADSILDTNPRQVRKKMQAANTSLTTEFRKFWDQYIGKVTNKIELEVQLDHHDDTVPEIAGKPYLAFWVKDGDEILYPGQRSEGVRWFLSFFLQLQAMKMDTEQQTILLVDEPGVCLHAKAQKNVLQVFEDTKDSAQIIYTTHSPYLIEVETIYRILAVQRSDEDDEKSETKVFSIQDVGGANRDTLMPLYTLIGVDLQHQRAVKKHNNVILEEPSAFYYLMGFKKLLNLEREINFLPATGVTNTKLYVNLFLGWGLDFLVVTDDDPEGKKARREIKKEVFGGAEEESKKHLMPIGKSLHGVEDLFTQADFKEFVLGKKSTSYTGTNSDYMKTSGRSKPLAGMKFYQKTLSGEIEFNKFGPNTQKQITDLMSAVDEKLTALAS